MAESSLIELEAGALEVALAPEVGGALARFAFRGHDLMRRAGRALVEDGDVHAAACFPLVPFSGRIADARFTFMDETFELEPNFGSEPHAIHGQGWQHPWEVRHASERWVELGFRHRVAGTPLDYEARQSFRLQDDALEVEIRVRNTGEGAMPAGLGLHPYFVRSPGVALQTRVSHMWLADERNIPRERVALPEHLDFSSPRAIASLELDNGFDGFDGKAQIVWPETGRRLTLQADPLFDRLVIYIPPDKDFFCVEPATHANNGFNMLDGGADGGDADGQPEVDPGVRILAPGEVLAGTIRFEAA